MEEEIEVDMDGEWRSASQPDWLTTYGVGPCIAVAIGSAEKEKAWLIHSPGFGHDTGALDGMIADATSLHPNGSGLKVWVFGGSAADENCEQEAEDARQAVKVALMTMPHASVSCFWLKGGSIEVVFDHGKWDARFISL